MNNTVLNEKLVRGLDYDRAVNESEIELSMEDKLRNAGYNKTYYET